MSYLLKDPASSLDYEVDWGADYLNGDLIVASRWSVAPEASDGLSIVTSAFDSIVARVTVEGGAQGQVYQLTNEVETLGGRRDRRSIALRVEKR